MRQYAQTLSQNDDKLITIGVVVSLILHLILLPLFLKSAANSQPPATIIEIAFEPAKTEQKQQIVSPSESPETAPPVDTTRLSDKDSSTEHEMIKRGLPDAGKPGPVAPPASKPQAAQQKTAAREPAPEKPAEKRSQVSPANADLRLNKAALFNTFSHDKPNQQQDAAKPQPFSRAPGSGAAFFGSVGTPDYLPSLPDGDMTMLNAKASKYATFVRRVAVQVFAALRSQGWESLRGSEINAAGGSTLARGILDKKGNLMRVQLMTRSGSNSFDDVVESSIKSGARDPNPPPDALADDGTYRFIFEARSWAVLASDPRTGSPSERRWLMLGTGLE